MIYHITNQENWSNAREMGRYEAPSLFTEGFIHTSKKEQVAGVHERYYKKASGLLLLHIDETKLTSPLRYELAPSINELFPHVYGPVNLDAIIKTEPL